MFPGQGSQKAGMGEELLDDEKLFKEKIEPQLEEVFKQLWEQCQNDSKKSLAISPVPQATSISF